MFALDIIVGVLLALGSLTLLARQFSFWTGGLGQELPRKMMINYAATYGLLAIGFGYFALRIYFDGASHWHWSLGSALGLSIVAGVWWRKAVAAQ